MLKSLKPAVVKLVFTWVSFKRDKSEVDCEYWSRFKVIDRLGARCARQVNGTACRGELLIFSPFVPSQFIPSTH